MEKLMKTKKKRIVFLMEELVKCHIARK